MMMIRCDRSRRRRVVVVRRPPPPHQQRRRLLFVLCFLLALYCCCNNIPGSSRGAPFVVAAAEETSEEQNKKSSSQSSVSAKEEQQQQQGECTAAGDGSDTTDGSCSASAATEENSAATTNNGEKPQRDQPKQEKDKQKEKKKKVITKPTKWVPLSESTWAVSATSPEPRKPSGDNMMDNDEVVGKDMNLSPYVHWTCYRMRSSSTARPRHASSDDKLHCCQTIYRMQQQFAGNLCWKRGGCRRDKKKRGGQEFHGKSEFMQYCIEQLSDVPPSSSFSSLPSSKTKTGNDDGSSMFDPRHTLVVLPERVDTYERRRLEEQPEGEQRYRQAIIFSTSTEGQFFYDIPVLSPLQLVIDPFEFYFDKQRGSRPGVGDEYDVVDLRTEEQKTKEEEERRAKYQKAEDEPVRFAAKLATTMYASSDDDDDDDERALHQRANVTLPPELVEEQRGLQRVLWTRITLRILVFLPQDTYLPTRRRNLSSCRQQQQQQDDQQQQSVECMLAWKLKQQQESSGKKSSYTSSPSEVQEVYELTVNLHPINNPYATSQISLEWMMKIMLEEEDLLLAAPVIFQGTVLHKSKGVAAAVGNGNDDDKKDATDDSGGRAALYAMAWDQGGNATKIACPLATASAKKSTAAAALLWNENGGK